MFDNSLWICSGADGLAFTQVLRFVLVSQFTECRFGCQCQGRWIGTRSRSAAHCGYALGPMTRLSQMNRDSNGFGSSLKVVSATDIYTFAGGSKLIRARQLNVGMFGFRYTTMARKLF